MFVLLKLRSFANVVQPACCSFEVGFANECLNCCALVVAFNCFVLTCLVCVVSHLWPKKLTLGPEETVALEEAELAPALDVPGTFATVALDAFTALAIAAPILIACTPNPINKGMFWGNPADKVFAKPTDISVPDSADFKAMLLNVFERYLLALWH